MGTNQKRSKIKNINMEGVLSEWVMLKPQTRSSSLLIMSKT